MCTPEDEEREGIMEMTQKDKNVAIGAFNTVSQTLPLREALNYAIEEVLNRHTPTALGAPLSGEEKQEISPVLPAGYMGSWISALWRKIDAVLAKRNTAPSFVTLTKSDWEAISDAVDTLNKWSQGRYKDEAGNSPTWNATCARLRDLRDKCNIVAPATLEERVTVKYVDGLGETGIFLGNKLQKSFTRDVDVSRYAAGMIAELAKETIREEN